MSNKKILSKVISSLGKYKKYLIISLFLSAASVFLTLYIPVLAGKAIDELVKGRASNIETIKTNLILIGVFALISAVIQWLINMLNNKVSYNTVRDLRNKAVAKICILPVSYIDKITPGDTVSRVISDADQLSDGLIMGFSQFFTGILTIICTLVFMVRINIIIALVVVVLTPLSLFIARFIARRTHSMFKAQSESRGKQTALIDEAVTNRKVITAYSAEEKFSKDFSELNNEFSENSLKAVFFSSITNPSTRFVNNMIYAAVAFSGALGCLSGSLTVGGLSCFLSYAGQYAKPFNEISGVIAEIQNALACAERLFEIIEAEQDTPDKENAVDITHAQGIITAEDVNFSYLPNRKLIENFNISVKKGSQTAIVGPTGCGKTTIINLLMRFYDVNSGRITLDGTDIRDIKRKSLRKNYGMVLQETWLKTGTVRENIIMGKPDASEEEIINASKAAHAHSFIMKLPDGYDTVVSDDTGGLSQGQKQLLCITRVLLSLPDIIILDEATSSIDTRTELKIRKAFKKLTDGKTSFIVAHRLSTIRNSDLILVMNNGNIVEQGTHTELLNKHGFYEELYSSRIY